MDQGTIKICYATKSGILSNDRNGFASVIIQTLSWATAVLMYTWIPAGNPWKHTLFRHKEIHWVWGREEKYGKCLKSARVWLWKMWRNPKSFPSVCFQGSEQESKGLPCKKGIVQSIVGQGYHRKIVLASQSTQNTIYRSVSIPESWAVKLLM